MRDIKLKDGRVIPKGIGTVPHPPKGYSDKEIEYFESWIYDEDVRKANPAVSEVAELFIQCFDGEEITTTMWDNEGFLFNAKECSGTTREFFAVFYGKEPSESDFREWGEEEDDPYQVNMSQKELIDNFIDRNSLPPRIRRALPALVITDSYDYDIVNSIY